MQSLIVKIEFLSNSSQSTKGTLTASCDGEILHSDIVDIARESGRSKFVKCLTDTSPGIDGESLKASILQELSRINDNKKRLQAQDDEREEVDVGNIVRPQLFHTAQVSGLVVPVTYRGGGDLYGSHLLATSWSDGKRELVDLPDSLRMNDGTSLMLRPTPTEPKLQTRSQWSKEARCSWVDGYSPDISDIFQRLASVFSWFLKFRDDDAAGHFATLSLWTMFTYAYPAWDAVPYLSVGGPLGSGKSRVFDVLVELVYKPINSANMTAPCLFRTLDNRGGTLLLDEAEKLYDSDPDLLNILLSGYKKGATAMRLEKADDTFVDKPFDIYCPKAFAAINNLSAPLMSRCIRVMMFRSPKDSPIPKRRIADKSNELQKLREDLHAMALCYGSKFVDIASWKRDCEALSGRNYEVWQPILALARLVEDAGARGLVEIVQTHASKMIELVSEDSVPETDEVVLVTLKEELDTNSYGITSSHLLAKLKEKEPAMFARYYARGIGSILKRYGIISQKSNGKRWLRPSRDELRVVRESYGIDFGEL